MASTRNSASHFSIFLIVGFICGSILAELHYQALKTTFPMFWLGLYGLMFLLALQNAASLKRLFLSTLIMSFLASLPCVWFNAWNEFSLSILVLVIINAYALNAFNLNYQINRFHFHYQTLFFAAWDTIVKIFITLVFTLLCWLILRLSASLFMLVNITFPHRLVSHTWFIIWILSIFISAGLYIATQIQDIIRHSRGILLLTCKYLFIPLAIIGTLFIVALLALRHLIFDQAVFVSIAFLSALFLNGIYQDGQEKNPYGILLSGLCRVFMVITPIFTAFALFIILFHSNNAIEKNGINTSNFPYFLIISVLFAYNISYAIIAFLQKKPWLKPIEKTNIVLAVILIVLTTATTNPLFFSILPKYKNNGIANNNVIAQQVSKQFNEAGFSWKAMTKNNIPKKALELGYDQKPIYFCRAKKDDHYEGGIVFNNTCKIIDKNHIKKITDFSVLTGPADKIAWLNWRIPMALNNTQSIVTFDSTTPNIPAICRSIYQNHILVGVSTGNNDYNCTAIFRGQIISVKQFVNFLYTIHKTY